MKAQIKLSVPVFQSARVAQCSGLFDVPPADRADREINVTLPIDEMDWQIGLIVGPSGSGKTQAARALWPHPNTYAALDDGISWDADRSILDGFPAGMGVKGITGLLSSVGFSSPPSWVKPWRVLSTGERFRANVARVLAEPQEPGLVAVLDEFTSVVDRTVARIGSAAVAKAVRRIPGRRVVCVTCHEDVAEWLDPDWVLVMPNGEFRAGRALRRPSIELHVGPCHRIIWQLFAPHHYLDAGLNKAASCYVARLGGGQPVAFAAVLAFPHPTAPGWREHRLVCLPDFQGAGIGNALSAMVAGAYSGFRGKPYNSTTGNPAMIAHRQRSPVWRMIRGPGLNTTGGQVKKKVGVCAGMEATKASNRITATFRYVGQSRPDLRGTWGLI